MVPYGASNMAEIDNIRRRLNKRAKEADLDKAWKEEWEREADRVAAYGDKADAEGFKITAGNQYMRAGNYYYSAERFIPPSEEKWAVYRKALRCYQGAMQRLHPDIERVEVPYEKGLTLPAYFVKGRGDAGRKPTVVLFDGMDNAKEMSVIFAGLDLAKRGFNVLAIDGPGQSEPLRLRNIPSRYDYEAAGIPAYDFVAARPDVDPKRVAVMGYSFGGYHAPRICAFDKRYAAGVAFGAMHWSVYDFVTSHGVADPTRASSSTFQWRWVVGAKDNAEGLEIAKKFTLEGVAQKVECPFLVVHGAGRPHRAGRCRAQALRGARFQEEGPAHLHRRGRRRGTLPGRSPPVRRRLHRRLADEEHVICITRWSSASCATSSAAGSLRLLSSVVLGTAPAQSNYPDRPIRLIVAFVPGGATDTLARQLNVDLQNALGQPVVVENRPGAGGYLAWNHVASSDPDGYTLLLAENAVAISQALYKKSKSPFDPITQYDAISGIAVAAVRADRRQQHPGQDREGAGGAFAHRSAASSILRPPGSAASRISTSKCSRTAPAWTPCTFPTKVAARR